MIYGNIGVSTYDHLLPVAFQKGLDYLRKTNFSDLEDGVYPIEGEDILAQLFKWDSKPIAQCKTEFHEQHVDLQYWLCGEEILGVAPRNGHENVIEENLEKDLYFCEQTDAERCIHTKAGDYLFLFPSDLHRPGGAWNGKPLSYRKVVIKIKTSLLEVKA